MMTFHPFDPTITAALRAGEPDVYGNPAEHAISSGVGTPCRSCLKTVPKNHDILIAAARPFPTLHAYAETGPIFLCEAQCTPHSGDGVPDILQTSPQYLIKAYDAVARIIYGTGQITPKAEVMSYVRHLLDMDDVAFVDVRSATNNCFLTRITRAA
jgi:hypothetical protein